MTHQFTVGQASGRAKAVVGQFEAMLVRRTGSGEAEQRERGGGRQGRSAMWQLLMSAFYQYQLKHIGCGCPFFRAAGGNTDLHLETCKAVCSVFPNHSKYHETLGLRLGGGPDSVRQTVGRIQHISKSTALTALADPPK